MLEVHPYIYASGSRLNNFFFFSAETTDNKFQKQGIFLKGKNNANEDVGKICDLLIGGALELGRNAIKLYPLGVNVTLSCVTECTFLK